MRKHRTASLPGQSPAIPGGTEPAVQRSGVLPDGGQLLADGWAVFPAAGYTTAA
jgi:hypothetical protein